VQKLQLSINAKIGYLKRLKLENLSLDENSNALNMICMEIK
jgi:hypothetical protein